PEGNGNIALEITASIKEEYKAKAYTLTLDEAQFATLNGDKGYYRSQTNVTFTVTSDVKEREIKVIVVIDDGDNKNYTVSNVGNNIVITVPDIDGKYVVGYALTPNGKIVFNDGDAIGYADLAIFNRDTVTLYPVYRDGDRPENTVLKIAVWGRYVEEETVKQLIEAYKQSALYNADFDVNITVLNSKDNTAYKADYDAGDYNVTFAYASQTLNSWQNTVVEVSIYNVNNSSYGTLKVGLNSNDTVVTNFGEFLATDEAKKIMNPNYVEVTLYNGEEKLDVKLVLSTDSLTLDTLDAEDGYVFAGWSANKDAVENETLFDKTVSYDMLAQIAQNKTLTLYARFVESSEVKENYTLKVALWSRYVDEETVKSLLEAYKLSTYFKAEFDVTYTVLTSNNNNNFKKDYDSGDYNVTFAYAAAAVDEWQGEIVEVYIFNVYSNSYGTLKVGLNSNDEVVTNFGLFLATDEAKKIMNPAYISETEADTIEVTLINGDTQYGNILTLSNATEADNKQIELPKITEIPAGYSAFEGWALTATATENETLLNGPQTYADLATYAKEGKLTLYARFAEDNDDGVAVIVIGYWSNSNYVTKDVADVIKEEFEKYLTDNEYTNFKVIMREYTETKVAALVDAIQADGDVDYFIGGGGNITTTKGTESKETLTTVGNAVTMTKRNIVQLTSGDLANEFTNYSNT
ncbi:MAG: hypothetical protein K2M64_01930, partial [Clostridia bacterium]|nr:hypothetical protein [Clostridia bacterium]